MPNHKLGTASFAPACGPERRSSRAKPMLAQSGLLHVCALEQAREWAPRSKSALTRTPARETPEPKLRGRPIDVDRCESMPPTIARLDAAPGARPSHATPTTASPRSIRPRDQSRVGGLASSGVGRGAKLTGAFGTELKYLDPRNSSGVRATADVRSADPAGDLKNVSIPVAVSGVRLLIRVIRRCVFYHRDLVAELSGKANGQWRGASDLGKHPTAWRSQPPRMRTRTRALRVSSPGNGRYHAP